MTAFFFASGYVYKDQASFKELICKKAKALLVPWFWFGMFNIITSQVLSFNEHLSLVEEIVWDLLQIRGLNDKMWFIAALFVAHIPFYFFVKYCNKRKRILISIVMFLLSFVYSFFVDGSLYPWGTNTLPWHLEYIFVINFYMVMGFEYKNLALEILDKFDKKQNKIIITGIYIILVTINYFGGFTMSDVFIYSILMNISLQLFGVAFCVIISKLIPDNKLISYIGMNTLIYYGLHGKVESIIETILRKVGIYQSICTNTILGILAGIMIVSVVSIVLLIPTWIINKYLPFVIGKKE